MGEADTQSTDKAGESDESAKEKSKQDLEAGGLTGAVRAATAWLRSILAQPRVRLFTPRRFQALHLIRGGSVKPEQAAIPTTRQIFRDEGVRGVAKRVALPLAANTASGTVLFAAYGVVEDWAAARVARTGGLLSLLEPPSLAHSNVPSEHVASHAALPLSCVAFAGAVAGGVHAVVTCPLDNYLSKLHAASLTPSPSPTPPSQHNPQKTPPPVSAPTAPSAPSPPTPATTTPPQAPRGEPQSVTSARRPSENATSARQMAAARDLKHLRRDAPSLVRAANSPAERPTPILRARTLSHLHASTSSAPASATLFASRAHALRDSTLMHKPRFAEWPRGSWIPRKMPTFLAPTLAMPHSPGPALQRWNGRVLARVFGGGREVSLLPLLREEACGLSGSASVARGSRMFSLWAPHLSGYSAPTSAGSMAGRGNGLATSWAQAVSFAQGGASCGGPRGMATATSEALPPGKRQSLHSRHLFTGLGISMTRDMASYGIFFLTYEYTKAKILAWHPDLPADPGVSPPFVATFSQLLRRLPRSKRPDLPLTETGNGQSAHSPHPVSPAADGAPEERHEELSLLGTIAAGAVSGATFRLVSFPIDWGREFWSPHPRDAPPHPLSAEAAVRSRLHVHTGVRGGARRSFRMLRRIYGPGSGFFPGLGWSIAASIPAAALTFLAYEFAQQLVEE